ncbi:MAG: hypothetical protein ABFS22_05500 [Pseudomonadota bacterium]
MKSLIIATFCIVIAMPALADDWREYCSVMGTVAETVMGGRQAGVPMEIVMQEIGKSNFGFLEDLVIAAYEQPRLATEQMQQRSIEKFHYVIYLQCAKALRNK